MSTLTTTTINTKDGATNLTVSTGNTSGPSIVVSSGTSLTLKANSTTTGMTINSTAANVALNTTVTGSLTTTGSLTVTPNTFNLGTSSIGASGYSRLPNGLLFQWGSVSANSTVGAVTFPTAFATLYSLTLAPTTTTVSTTYLPYITASSTTAATILTTNAAAKSISWMAIGV